jgi:hypothetical protein
MAFEAVSHSILPTTLPSLAIVISKAARFEWELPCVKQEMRAYQLLDDYELAPRFLAHVHKNGRIIGFYWRK